MLREREDETSQSSTALPVHETLLSTTDQPPLKKKKPEEKVNESSTISQLVKKKGVRSKCSKKIILFLIVEHFNSPIAESVIVADADKMARTADQLEPNVGEYELAGMADLLKPQDETERRERS